MNDYRARGREWCKFDEDWTTGEGVINELDEEIKREKLKVYCLFWQDLDRKKWPII